VQEQRRERAVLMGIARDEGGMVGRATFPHPIDYGDIEI
jgi:hypothetical protein